MPNVRVGPLPEWMPIDRLLGPQSWTVEPDSDGVLAIAELSRDHAADVLARLRGLAFGGLDLRVQVRPSLKRPQVRAGRLREARAMRDRTPGFAHPSAKLDEEGRFSLTPEALALDLGTRAHARTVADLTCGAGGNAIGFARAGSTVVAVERDPGRLALARHNARLYGVERQITFRPGDARELVSKLRADLVFVDPPWGSWDHRRTVLSDLPLLASLLQQLRPTDRWWAKVPPSFVPSSVPADVSVEAWFGDRPGDRHRVKFLLLRHDP